MDVVASCAAGLDVHQNSVVVCLLTKDGGRKMQKEFRRFGTMTKDLRELARWLAEARCESAVMEGTGVYWMPVYAALEEAGVPATIGNARHIAKVPGRKTDVNDAEWLATLARHGLVRPSFVPPALLREVRDLLRYRRKLVEHRSAERLRVLKHLELAGIKLASVASDAFGVSGTAILRALAAGNSTPEEMAKLAKGLLKKKVKLLEDALDGRFTEHHRLILRIQLQLLDDLQKSLDQLEAAIAERLKPFSDVLKNLQTIPGIDTIGAATLVAELGVDMSVFPTARHAAAWAGLAPGQNESAGKSRAAPTTRGNKHLKTVLAECALAISRMKGTWLRDKFYRVKARRGHQRALIAIAHKLLRMAYAILRDNKPYHELGPEYLDRKDTAKTAQRLIGRLRNLGYEVDVRPTAEPSAA